MNYIPQIVKRRIGEVEILDLKGDFVGPWAIRGKEEIHQYLESHKPKSLLFNLKNVETIDSLGVRAIVDNLAVGAKSGVVSGNYSVAEMFSRLGSASEIRFFKDEEEVVNYFSKELVRETLVLPEREERRRFPRLKTALSLEFWYTREGGEKVFFRSIITNLSEGGLYAEYLDAEPTSENLKKLDPYDFKMLELRIKLPDESEIYAEGKVTRTDIEGEQMGIGIEFYRINDEDRSKIARFVKV